MDGTPRLEPVLHNCQFIVDFHTEPGEDGDPILCDKPASIKLAQGWLCAEHYDEVLSFVKDAVDKAADL
jgi:hypothetical protein